MTQTIYGDDGSPGPSSTPAARPVSYAQARLTFLIVYPPPPRSSSGLWKDLTNLTQFACPRMDRFKQPSLSPDNESVPHWRTIADGS